MKTTESHFLWVHVSYVTDNHILQMYNDIVRVQQFSGYICNIYVTKFYLHGRDVSANTR